MLNNAQTLNMGRMVEMITIGLSDAPGRPEDWTDDLYLSNSSVSYNVGPTWDGTTYAPSNFKISGINIQAGGQMPEPTLEIACAPAAEGNLLGFIQTPGASILGAKVTRYIMSVNCLDGGSNASTDENDRIEQSFYIIQISNAVDNQITFKMSPALGLDRLNDKVNRTLSTNQCNKKYRVWNIRNASFDYVPVEDGGCEWGQASEAANFPYVTTWGTTFFDANDQVTTDPAKDRCGQCVSSCLKRFPNPSPTDPFPININPNNQAGT